MSIGVLFAILSTFEEKKKQISKWLKSQVSVLVFHNAYIFVYFKFVKLSIILRDSLLCGGMYGFSPESTISGSS